MVNTVVGKLKVIITTFKEIMLVLLCHTKKFCVLLSYISPLSTCSLVKTIISILVVEESQKLLFFQNSQAFSLKSRLHLQS